MIYFLKDFKGYLNCYENEETVLKKVTEIYGKIRQNVL